VVVSIRGKRRYLGRAVDQDGDVLEILVVRRKDTRAARRFFRKLLKGQGQLPLDIITDKLASYGAAKRGPCGQCVIAQSATPIIGPRYPTSTLASVSGKCEDSDVMAMHSAF